jgi:hypothetical protein
MRPYSRGLEAFPPVVETVRVALFAKQHNARNGKTALSKRVLGDMMAARVNAQEDGFCTTNKGRKRKISKYLAWVYTYSQATHGGERSVKFPPVQRRQSPCLQLPISRILQELEHFSHNMNSWVSLDSTGGRYRAPVCPIIPGAVVEPGAST